MSRVQIYNSHREEHRPDRRRRQRRDEASSLYRKDFRRSSKSRGNFRRKGDESEARERGRADAMWYNNIIPHATAIGAIVMPYLGRCAK